MSGRMVSAGPRSPGEGTQDSLASVDERRGVASILVSGDRPHVVVYGLGATPFLMRDGRVHVRVEVAPHNDFCAVSSPVLLGEHDVEASDQSLELTVPIQGWDAARIVLSAPTAGRTAGRRPGAGRRSPMSVVRAGRNERAPLARARARPSSGR
jgi:hypothetical protein